MFKARILYSMIEDEYERGEIGPVMADWVDTITADTVAQLKTKVMEATHSPNWDDFSDEQINDYEFATEYVTSYLTSVDDYGAVSQDELERWELGKLKLFSVVCHILVSEITEKKATL